MKKLLCLALTLAMILLAFPVATFAADDAPIATQGNVGTHQMTALDTAKAAEGYVFRIGDGTTDGEYYKTINEVFGALDGNAATTSWAKNIVVSGTITMIANAGAAAWNNTNADGLSFRPTTGGLTFDGNGYSVENTGTAFFMNPKGLNGTLPEGLTQSDVTIKNLTVNAKGFLNLFGDGSVPLITNVENCTVTVSTNEGILTNQYNAGNHNNVLNMTNTVLTVAATATAATQWYGWISPISVQGSGNWTFNLNNSTLTNANGYTGSDFAAAVINVLPGKNAPTAMNGKNVTVNVTNGTKLVSASKAPEQWIIGAKHTGSLTVNLDATAELVMAPAAGAALTATKMIYHATSENLIVSDAGAKLSASAAAVKAGIVIFNTLPKMGDALVLGWTDGENNIATGASYTNANATADVTFEAVTVDGDSFSMVTGAAIRTAEPIGIRFTVKVSDALLKAFEDFGVEATFSTVIAPYKYVQEANADFIPDNLLKGDYVIATQESLSTTADADGYISYYAALVDLPETATAVNMKFAGRGIMTLTTADGAEVVIYTDFNETDHVRSMYDVAEKVIAEAEYADNAVIKRIVELGGAQ